MKTVHISTMSGKLQGLRAISTNTLTNEYCIKQNSCGNEDNICTKCYSHSMLSTFRKNTAPALQRNSDLLSSALLEDRQIPFINDAFHRFSAHGELINDIHLANLCKIAEFNPFTKFSLWTKRNDIVQKYFAEHKKPDNLTLLYSNPKIGTILSHPPRNFDKTFNNVRKGEFVDQQNCTGQKCVTCLLCYNSPVTTIVEAVK